MTVIHFSRAAWLSLLVAPLLHAQSAPTQVNTPPACIRWLFRPLKVNYPTR